MKSTDPTGVAARLADFPWDLLAPLKARAAAHPDGLVDLSVGTPVDPTPASVQAALSGAANSPGYPLTAGSPELVAAIGSWVHRHTGTSPAGVLPVIGTKELVGLLPMLLGFGPDDLVVIPELAYPTYRIGAELVRARVLATDDPTRIPSGGRTLVWLNSPANPSGRVLGADLLRTWINWAREHDAIVASDECYAEIWWDGRPASLLDQTVCEGDQSGLLALFSLSKRSNLAGYRSGYVAGDPGLIGDLLVVRKHLGLMTPAPIQAASIAALGDQSHVRAQVERYGGRRELLAAAIRGAGLRIEESEAGLYLWATRDEDCWATARWFAERGILVAPGTFYGQAGAHHVRLALTVTDERLRSALHRL